MKKLIIPAVALGVLLTGCSHTKIKMRDANIAKEARIYTSANAVCTSEDANNTKVAQEIEKNINERLKAKKAYGDELTIKCNLLKFNEGNMALRFLVGWGAGQANAMVQNEVYKADEKVGEFKADIRLNSSSSSNYVAEEGGEQIANYVLKRLIKK